MDTIYLSASFSLQQMLNSRTANQKGITEQYTPSNETISNLRALCSQLLEPLRAKIGKPVIITSGYRCPRLNAVVGGVNTSNNVSQHTKGEAADTYVEGMTIEEWYQFIKTSGLAFDQLIQEFDSWAHVSFNAGGIQRGQCLRIHKGGNYVADGHGSFKGIL